MNVGTPIVGSMTNVEVAQTFMASRLRSLDYFKDIYIGAPRVFKAGDAITTPKTIHDQIDRALGGLQTTGGKIGAAVRVFQPTFNNKKPNLPGLQGMMTLLCRCETHPIFNFSATGTNKYVSEIGFEVLRAGQFRFGNIGSFFAEGDCFIPYYSQDTKLMTVDILLQCNLAVKPLNNCLTPTCSVAGPVVTLTNLTANAAIWYSLDPTVFPSEFEKGAVLYNGPFDAGADPDSILFAAYASDMAGSPVGYFPLNQN